MLLLGWIMRNRRFALFSLVFVLIIFAVVFGSRFFRESGRVDVDSERVQREESALKQSENLKYKDKQSEQAIEKKDEDTSESKTVINSPVENIKTAGKTSISDNKQKALKVVNPRAITPKDDFISPRWSPDGLDVIYTKAKYNGLYIVSSDGKGIRQLSDEEGIGYNVQWSKDGSKLIVEKDGKKKALDLTGEESSAEGLYDQDMISAKDDNIYLQNPQTGEYEMLTDSSDKFFDPKMSPDGDKVAYQGLSSGLYIKDLESGEVISLGNGAGYQWTPDGGGLIYNISQDDGMKLLSSDIFYASKDGSQIINITNTPDIIEHNPYISPDGKKITYEVDGQIFVADIESAD